MVVMDLQAEPIAGIRIKSMWPGVHARRRDAVGARDGDRESARVDSIRAEMMLK